jgi:hypothetical protein
MVVSADFAAYLDAGGKDGDIDTLRATVFSRDLGSDLDPLGVAETAGTDESIELTSELLADAIRLAHPDHHPPERQELANHVTKALLALQPFVFPAPKPKPAAPTNSSRQSVKIKQRTAPSERLPRFPCRECAGTVPDYYCAACMGEWQKRCLRDHDRVAAKRRAWYARRKEQRLNATPPTSCVACGASFRGRRPDARFCSDRCRQRAHRSATAKNNI